MDRKRGGGGSARRSGAGRGDLPLHGEQRQPFVGAVAAFLAVQARHPHGTALVVQGDDLPEAGVEHRAARAAAEGRGPVVQAADTVDLRLAVRRALMVEQLVVLERERQGAATRDGR